MDEIDKSKESIVKIIDSQNVIKTKEKSWDIYIQPHKKDITNNLIIPSYN
jgi:hypothetical protein